MDVAWAKNDLAIIPNESANDPGDLVCGVPRRVG
jgi:hypothetical protein